MSDDKTIDVVIEKEKASAARAERKLKILTCKDAGMPEDMAELFVDARGDRYVVGADGKIRHKKSQVEMLSHLETKVKERRPTFFGGVTQQEKSAADSATLELEQAAFGSLNLKARGDLVKQLGEAEAIKRAQAWGLKGLTDRSPGTRPELAKIEAGKAKTNNADNDRNPFSAKWWNITEQGRLYRLNPTLAQSMATKAGVKIGALRPVA
jgi:hypothetical protein